MPSHRDPGHVGPGSVSVAATVAATNLRRLARDRTGLFFILVLPVVVITVIGVAISGGDDGSTEWPLGVFAADGTEELAEALAAAPQLDVQAYDERAVLESAVRRETVAGGVALEADVADALGSTTAGKPAAVEFLAPPGREPPVALRQRVATVVAAHGAGLDPDREQATVTAEQRLAGPAQPSGSGAPVPSGFDYTAPSNLVLFVFINTLVSAGLFAESRQLGVLHRASGAPISRVAVLSGEVVSRLVVALGQAAFILAIGAAVFGVHWGEPLAVATIVGLFALAATGAAMLLGAAVRRDATITALAPPLGIALGMLGGTMWPLEIVGDSMRAVGHLTPHAWAMDAFVATIGAGAGVRDVLAELGALAAFAAVLLVAAGVVLSRRSLAPSD